MSDFWIVTPYFNPVNSIDRYNAFKSFAERIREQGAKLCCVELYYQDSKKISPNDCDLLLSYPSNSILWHKNRLINLGFDAIPEDTIYSGWVDCDLLIKDNDWVVEAIEKLKSCQVIQGFSRLLYLNQGQSIADVDEKKNISYFSFVKNLKDNPEFLKGRYRGKPPGGIWLYRHELIKELKLFDQSVVGGGDRLHASAFNHWEFPKRKIRSQKLIELEIKWHEKAKKIFNGKCDYLDTDILHIWHGDLENRQYRSLSTITHDYNYNPEKDITLDKNQIWKWTGNNPKLEKRIYNYFIDRKEE